MIGAFVRAGVRRYRGFTLIEMMIAIAVLLFVMGLFVGAYVKARRRVVNLTRAADARRHIARATEEIARDIRRASGVQAGANKLTLLRPDGTIIWKLEDGQLVRVAGDERTVYAGQLARLRINAEDSGLVEIGLALRLPGHTRESVFYTAAGPRLSGAEE